MSLGFTEFNPAKYIGDHRGCEEKYIRCICCQPADKTAYLMRVGEKFYPKASDFLEEANRLGISKRFSELPVNFKLGVTPIYLAHGTALETMVAPGQTELMSPEPVDGQPKRTKKGTVAPNQGRLVDAPHRVKKPAIFMVFIPQRIEKIYWQSQIDGMSDKERESLSKRGITPVGVTDGDADHAPKKPTKKAEVA